MWLSRPGAAAAVLVGLIATASAYGQGLPPPVQVRPDPEGVTLGDPAFEALPDARADSGRLGGSVYQIEVPARWNGGLVLFMHGFGELSPVAEVSPPGIRRYLIGRGFAWGASSFSSTSLIPGRAADETAALWDLFVRRHGRPRRSYVTGQSMGGMATHIAAERYGDRFDGALGLCGAAGQTPAAAITTDHFVAGAYAAGVTQREFDRTPDVARLVEERILPALRRPRTRRRFEDIMISLTGGRRAFAREGFRMEEETNWQRAALLVATGIAQNRDTVYRLGRSSPVTSRQFNAGAIRLRTNHALRRAFLAGNETTGRLEMPLLTIHTTGDGQVPIRQARILQRRVAAAGRRRLLVQRVLRDPGHCGFTSTEWEAGFEALVRWVASGVSPEGNLGGGAGRFELSPRPGTPEAEGVPGARRRVTLHGRLTLEGAPLNARFLGAVVRDRRGLTTPCQLALSPVRRGRYRITVMAQAEASGCGGSGRRIALWTFSEGRIVYSPDTRTWPVRGGGAAGHDAAFSSASPGAGLAPRSEFAGEVYRPDGRHLPGGTRVDAYIGGTRCGVTSVRRTGSFSGFSLDVAGPESVPGCARGGTITFRVDGRRAPDTAVNDPASSGRLDLTLP